MPLLHRPQNFPGSKEEVKANKATHYFLAWEDETRCVECDCRPFSITAEWPCGTKVPRTSEPINL